MITNKILNQLIEVLRLGGVPYSEGDIEIQDLGVPHQPPMHFAKGKMAVYSFFYKDKALKIGRSGPTSNSRYTTQHYNSGSAPSTLAASLEKKPEHIGLTKNDVQDSGNWLKQNTQRVNLIVESRLGIDALNLIEAFLIVKFTPVYEGFDTQRRK